MGGLGAGPATSLINFVIVLRPRPQTIPILLLSKGPTLLRYHLATAKLKPLHAYINISFMISFTVVTLVNVQLTVVLHRVKSIYIL